MNDQMIFLFGSGISTLLLLGIASFLWNLNNLLTPKDTDSRKRSEKLKSLSAVSSGDPLNQGAKAVSPVSLASIQEEWIERKSDFF